MLHTFKDGELLTAKLLNDEFGNTEKTITAAEQSATMNVDIQNYGENILNFTAVDQTSAKAIIKTGHVVCYASVAYGNAYAPQIDFTTPFPGGLASILILPLVPGSGYIGTLPTLDIAKTTGFRAYWPGETNTSYKRAFTWIAIGY